MMEKRRAIVFDALRDGYGIDQIARKAMTVAGMRELLADYEDDDIIVMSHDNGYTYGSCYYLEDYIENEDGEWLTEEE